MTQHPADLMLLMLGFNDLGWFYSDTYGTLDSIHDIITNARNVNPSIRFALANIPERSFIGGRQDLVDNTRLYNQLLPGYIGQWTTAQSPIQLVPLEETYDCHPESCPVGYDGLHPNELGEYQIANAFTTTLVNDFQIGRSPIAIANPPPSRPLPVPANFQLVSSPQGVTATWDPVYGAYSYTVRSSLGEGVWDFSPGSVSSNRFDSQWALEGFHYTVSVAAAAGDRVGEFTAILAADSHPQTAPGPRNVNVQPTADGFTVTWDPPTGPYTDDITEYNILYWDHDPRSCAFISGAAFTSSPGTVTGLTPGHRILVAPITWNARGGEGFPEIVHDVIPAGGTPGVPSGLQVTATDPTSIYGTFNEVPGAAGYTLWIRNTNDPESVSTPQNATLPTACFTDFYLFPGAWYYEFCVSSFNGNLESGKSECIRPARPSGTSPAGSCPSPAAWCTDPQSSGSSGGGSGSSGGGGAASGSVSGSGSGSAGSTTVVGGTTTTASGGSITVIGGTTVVGGSTSVLPDGSTTIVGGSTIGGGPGVGGGFGQSTLITTTLPGGAVVTTSVPLSESTVTTTVPDGSVITIVTPVPMSESAIVTTQSNGQPTTVFATPSSSGIFATGSVTSTMTTVPPGVSVQDFTDFPISSNIWLTTTGADHSSTILPVLLPCETCEPEIIWDVPEEQNVEFNWPTLPELPTWHFPCVKIFGIHISGECPSPEGPTPIIDGPPPRPQPSTPSEPGDEGSADPCEMDMTVGMCSNGNSPVFDTSTGTINCSGSMTLSTCQQNIDSHLQDVRDYLENERSCCPPTSKSKRGSMSLWQRGTEMLGLSKRADFCPQPGQNPKRPPAGQCYATYTCPHFEFPNVCGNAKSAISNRGATSILTHVKGSDKHDVRAW